MPKRLWKIAKTSPLVRFVLEDKQRTENKLREIDKEAHEGLLTREFAKALSNRVMAYHQENSIAPKVANTIFAGGNRA